SAIRESCVIDRSLHRQAGCTIRYSGCRMLWMVPPGGARVFRRVVDEPHPNVTRKRRMDLFTRMMHHESHHGGTEARSCRTDVDTQTGSVLTDGIEFERGGSWRSSLIPDSFVPPRLR